MSGAVGAIRAGAAFVEIGANTLPFSQGIDSTKAKLQEFASAVRVSAAILTGFLTSVAAAGLKTTSVASDMQEQQAKFDVVFKHNIENMNKWRDKFAEVMRLSKLDLTSWLAQAQDTFVPLGFAREDAESLSKLLVRLGLDLAAFNNMAPEDTQRNLISGLVGEPEALRKYGIIINDAALETELFKMGIQGGTEAASEQEKMLARLAIILKSTTDAQGQATRESDGWAAGVRGLTSQFGDLMRVVGEQLIPMLTPYVELVTDSVEATKQWLEANPQIVESLLQVFSTLAKILVLAGGLSVLVFTFGTLPGQILLVVLALAAVLDYLGLVDTGFQTLADNIFIHGDTISGHLEKMILTMKLKWKEWMLALLTSLDVLGTAFEDWSIGVAEAIAGKNGPMGIVMKFADGVQNLLKMVGMVDSNAPAISEQYDNAIKEKLAANKEEKVKSRTDYLDKRADEIFGIKGQIDEIDKRRKDPAFMESNKGKDWLEFFNGIRNKPPGEGGEQFGGYDMPNIKAASKQNLTPKKDEITGFFGGINVAEMLGSGVGTFSIEKEQLNALKNIKDAITSLPQEISDKLSNGSTSINVAPSSTSLIPNDIGTPPSVPQIPSVGISGLLNPGIAQSGSNPATAVSGASVGVGSDTMSKLLSTAEKIEVNTRIARTPTYR